ncbi:unnamed protein product [Leptidea sinapis]|uniref:Uncharacterized protein n=1 Tax=Leptidea sinapis TaxID=189913 RepID=A0A5E4QHE8_9NEOP|nr:unnamed protein product [Leptidea sinapis]
MPWNCFWGYERAQPACKVSGPLHLLLQQNIQESQVLSLVSPARTQWLMLQSLQICVSYNMPEQVPPRALTRKRALSVLFVRVSVVLRVTALCKHSKECDRNFN